jgi:arylsulfatase A
MIGTEPIGRRQVLGRVTSLGVATAALLAQQPQRKPNVIVILADDLGYGDLSAWGGCDLRTPNIDALAASGVRFDRFYANSLVCSPTRAAAVDRAAIPTR